jgi:hypothetical protein
MCRELVSRSQSRRVSLQCCCSGCFGPGVGLGRLLDAQRAPCLAVRPIALPTRPGTSSWRANGHTEPQELVVEVEIRLGGVRRKPTWCGHRRKRGCHAQIPPWASCPAPPPKKSLKPARALFMCRKLVSGPRPGLFVGLRALRALPGDRSCLGLEERRRTSFADRSSGAVDQADAEAGTPQDQPYSEICSTETGRRASECPAEELVQNRRLW